MELVDGRSLHALIAERRLAVAEATRIGDEVLQALAAAHRAGIVHRDVKPGNVLIRTDGMAKLADFGIAKPLDELAADVTATGHVVGTPAYLAPEQVRGERATPATDVYAVGVLLFEMLAGRPPFVADSPIAIALAHRDATVPDVRDLRPDVPRRVADVIRRAMAKDPADRFASADAMRAALAAPERRVAPTVVGGPVPVPRAVPARVVVGRARRRGRHRRHRVRPRSRRPAGPARAGRRVGHRRHAARPVVRTPAPPPSRWPPVRRRWSRPSRRRSSPTVRRPCRRTVRRSRPRASASCGCSWPRIPPASVTTPGRSPAACRASTTASVTGEQRDVERLLERVADWEDEGELGPAAAALIVDVLPVTSGDDDDDDD